MNTLATYAVCVTGISLIVAALLVIVGCDLRARERQVRTMRAADHADCWRDIDDAVRVAAYWRGKAEARYQAPSFVGERADLAGHIADALALTEAANVVPLRKGQ